MEINPRKSFESAWKVTRGLTYDLLDALSEQDLLFTPGEKLGPFWKQFRHVGSCQECYLEALKESKVEFKYEDKGYVGGASRSKLKKYLKRLDKKLFKEIEDFSESDWTKGIFWSEDYKPTVYEHLMNLVQHETLHHGEWIVYVFLGGFKFPESWGTIWGL
jgi:uncharacterized damage-inducible protein DinB